MKKIKFAFYCSGKASRVIKFYESRSLEEYSVDFVLYDGGLSEVEQKLKKLFNSKVLLYKNPNGFKGKDLSQEVSNILLGNMQRLGVDYLFCFGDRVLKPNLIDFYKNRIINFHPSLLPAFPGIKAIDQALASSVQILGNTAHFIDYGIDTGPIIMQSVLSRSSFKDYEDVLKLQLHMLQRIWKLLEHNRTIVEDNRVLITELEESLEEQTFFSL
jgi:phosphoribosylglycinamide formyltransferase-1